MGLINDVFEDSLPGLVIGAVATAVVLPFLGGKSAETNSDAGSNGRRRGRQLLKAAVRGYVTVADRLKEATAEAREQFSDLAAEIREERRVQAEAAADEEAPVGRSHHARTSHRKKSENSKT
jgi:hypothetical protein